MTYCLSKCFPGCMGKPSGLTWKKTITGMFTNKQRIVDPCNKYITSQAIQLSPRDCKHHLPLLLRGVEGPERTIPEMNTMRRSARKLWECCCIPIIIICAVSRLLSLRCNKAAAAAVIWMSSVQLRYQRWDAETRGYHSASLHWLSESLATGWTWRVLQLQESVFLFGVAGLLLWAGGSQD